MNAENVIIIEVELEECLARLEAIKKRIQNLGIYTYNAEDSTQEALTCVDDALGIIRSLH